MNQPTLIVCMGVSGVGKSTVAAQLADALSFRMLEADIFHLESDRAQMGRGQGLSNAQRNRWMARVCSYLERERQNDASIVMAHSALRRAHRAQLRGCGFQTFFVHLHASPETIARRLEHRRGHFSGASLLPDQLIAFEPPVDETGVIPVAVDGPPGDVLTAARDALARCGVSPLPHCP